MKTVLSCHAVDDTSVLKEPRLSFFRMERVLCQTEWTSMNETCERVG